MVYTLLSYPVDLNQPPIFPGASSTSITEITLGDLHANAIKLVHALVRYGVCDIEAGAFKALLVADEKDFLACIQDKLQIKDKKILVRLIGDIVADRGENDLYVLAVLDKLRSNNVPVTTLISNHDVELILAYEAYQKKGKVLGTRGDRGIMPEQKQSLIALSQSIASGQVVSKAEFERLMDTVYLPTLKLIDYRLTDTTPKHITVFTHAPIDLDGIYELSNQFNIPYQAESVEELAHTIDQINTACRFKIQSGAFTRIYEKCIHTAVWNREENLKAGSDSISAKNISFVYGHTIGGAHERKNVFKIDNKLGKGPDMSKGDDPVFVLMEVDKVIIASINDALSVLQTYSAGTAVNEMIQSIQDDMKHHLFQQAQTKVKQLKNYHFEGQRGKNLDAETRGVLERAWYNVIAGIRFFLSLLTAIFTKKSEHKNPVAEWAIGRPFFFQKPRTKAENALIEEKMKVLEAGKAELFNALELPRPGVG